MGLVWLLMGLSPVTSGAQDSSKVDLSTPQAALRTHLENLQPDHYKPERAAACIPPNTGSMQERARLAKRLKQILDARGIYIFLDQVPDRPSLQDSGQAEPDYVLNKRLPDVYLTRQNDRWRYSLETVRRIPELYRDAFPLGSDLLVNMLPRVAQKQWWSLQYWQWLGIFLVLALGWFTHQVLRRLLSRIIDRLTGRLSEQGIPEDTIRAVVKPLSLAFVLLLAEKLLPSLQLPVQWMAVAELIFRIAIPVYATMVFYNAVAVFNIYFERRAAQTENTLDDQLAPLIRKATKTLVILLGGVFILRNLGISVATLLTGISIGGLALALAAQDTLKNFFGSLMIFIDRPFGIGDWIVTPDLEGIVEEVGFRSTRVRTFSDSLVSIPNGRLADSTIDNKGLRTYRRFYTTLQLPYNTPTHELDAFVEGLRHIIRAHPTTRKDFFEIHLNDFGPYAIKMLVYLFFDCPTWSEELRSRHRFISEVLQLAEAHGIRFALPAQHIQLDANSLGTTPSRE